MKKNYDHLKQKMYRVMWNTAKINMIDNVNLNSKEYEP